MLRLDNLNYASTETVIYQRLTVMVTEIVFFMAAWRYAAVNLVYGLHLLIDALLPIRYSQHTRTDHGMTHFALIFLNPGLMMVDNIHFQYNGFLYGILVWSIDLILEVGKNGVCCSHFKF